MLTLTALEQVHGDQLAEICVSDEQIEFVGTVADILANVDYYVHPHVVMHSGNVVGCFLIDTAYQHGQTCRSHIDLGLRAFFIDQHYQGRGLGQQVIQRLPRYLNAHYHGFETLYLTVNCRNNAAYSCYKKSGFIDTDELYHGGFSGPQHVMYLML